MNYWDYRKEAAKIIPRMSQLPGNRDGHVNKEKGRKSNYQQYSITEKKMEPMERLLDKDSINSFVEVSLRAQSCPMPLNLDVWDGLRCPFKCRYCFPAGTKILMADGTEKVIERVREGERIMSYNENTGEIEPAVVEEAMSRFTQSDEDFIEIETEEGNVVKMTPEHPVFVVGKGWVKAMSLNSEDEVLVW
jgi:hypothetical protein